MASDPVTAIADALGAGLNLLAGERNPDLQLRRWALKIRKEIQEVKEGYSDEKGKPNPDMSVLDDFERRLFMLRSAIESPPPPGQADPPKT